MEYPQAALDCTRSVPQFSGLQSGATLGRVPAKIQLCCPLLIFVLRICRTYSRLTFHQNKYCILRTALCSLRKNAFESLPFSLANQFRSIIQSGAQSFFDQGGSRLLPGVSSATCSLDPLIDHIPTPPPKVSPFRAHQRKSVILPHASQLFIFVAGGTSSEHIQ